jgi:hypothetical protein
MESINSVESKLELYQIDIKRYVYEMIMLQELKFSALQAKNLILRADSAFSVQQTLELTPVLLDAPYYLSHEQIFKLALDSDFPNKLEVFINFYQNLTHFNFNKEQIIEILCITKSIENLMDSIKHFKYLIKQHFTIDQLYKVLIKSDSSRKFDSIAKTCRILFLAKISHEAIIKIVLPNKGNIILDAIEKSIQELLEANFEIHQIITMLVRTNYPKNIITIAGIYQFLKNHGFTPAHLLKIIYVSGMSCLKPIRYSYSESMELGISPDQMIILVLRYANTMDFDTLFKTLNQFKNLGFTTEQLFHIALQEDGLRIMQIVIQSTPCFQKQGIHTQDIVQIASNQDALSKIKAIAEARLKNLKPVFHSSSNIVHINQLRSVLKEFEELEELELSIAQNSNSSEEIDQQKNQAITPALSISATTFEDDLSTEDKIWVSFLKDLENTLSSNAAQEMEETTKTIIQESTHSSASLSTNSLFSIGGEKRKLDEISYSAPGAKK